MTASSTSGRYRPHVEVVERSFGERNNLSFRAVTDPNLPDSSVRLDTRKNRKLLFLSLAILAAGLGLLGFGWTRGWGFVAMFWSGVLALLGGAWVVGIAKGGGVAIAACPHCGAKLEFTHIASARTVKCDRCGEWSAGTEVMAPLAPDHLAELPVFPVPLPDSPRWPTDASGAMRCPVTGGDATRMIEVQATSALGDAFAALSPISVQRVHSLRVPASVEHDDGIWLDMGEDDQSLILLFRSYAYYREFLELNRAEAAAPAEAAEDVPQTLASFLETNPRPADLRAPLTCPKHGTDVFTAMGWVTTMDVLPSHEWLDAAAEHPMCLAIGHHLSKPERGNHTRERLVWCPACEAGMAARG